MNQYYQLFAVIRVSKSGCDVIRDGGTNHQKLASKDVQLILNNYMYRLPVYTQGHQRLGDADFTNSHRNMWAKIC
jgi:hypothetical protein